MLSRKHDGSAIAKQFSSKGEENSNRNPQLPLAPQQFLIYIPDVKQDCLIYDFTQTICPNQGPTKYWGDVKKCHFLYTWNLYNFINPCHPIHSIKKWNKMNREMPLYFNAKSLLFPGQLLRKWSPWKIIYKPFQFSGQWQGQSIWTTTRGGLYNLSLLSSTQDSMSVLSGWNYLSKRAEQERWERLGIRAEQTF